MSYQAIYRRFRPKTFESVVGQEHVTTTLKNQIVSNNIAHAYLFSGTRGTGKTSTAKIFARAVNCLNNNDGNPCNECEICRGILNDTIMDVVEMDAASNNSVDDIRELREKVKYSPSKGKYKVYIIDEVHMLSKGAFNALLKTLEEPPEHLLFILATTEPQRIPATILSRCQRFDFKRITTNDIVKNMREICTQLGIDVEDKSLHLIAKNSDGAMRDALSILDQCVSFTDGKITYEYVLSILGIVNNDFLFEISNTIIKKDIDATLGLIDQVVQSGKDINQFIKNLIMHFRNLMIAKSTNKIQNIIDGSDEYITQLKEQAELVELDEIIRYINILSETEVQSKWASQPRVTLEIGIIKLLDPATDTSIEGLYQRVKQLENMIKDGSFKLQSSKEAKINEQPKSKEVKKKETNTKQVKKKEESQQTDELASTEAIEPKDVNFQQISSAWSEILKKIKADRISIHAFLMEGNLVNLNDNILTISFEDGFGFHKEAVEKRENKEYIEGIINNYLGSNIKINCIMSSELQNDKNNQDDDNLVKKVIDIFGEDIVEIENKE